MTDPNHSTAATQTQQVPQSPKKQTGLALAALLVGIGAFLVGLIPVFGALVGIVAVVLGALALRKRQSKGMAVTGIVLGATAAVVSIAVTFGIGAAVNNASEQTPAASIAPSESATPQETTAQETTAPEPIEPAVEEAPEPAAPVVPAEYASALVKAASYSELMNMSKAGIYGQLTSEYGEQFSPEAAQYAIDTYQGDWNANALAKAKSYQETMSMSPDAIRDQLTSEYGEQFTPEEADYAIQNLNG